MSIPIPDFSRRFLFVRGAVWRGRWAWLAAGRFVSRDGGGWERDGRVEWVGSREAGVIAIPRDG